MIKYILSLIFFQLPMHDRGVVVGHAMGWHRHLTAILSEDSFCVEQHRPAAATRSDCGRCWAAVKWSENTDV